MGGEEEAVSFFNSLRFHSPAQYRRALSVGPVHGPVWDRLAPLDVAGDTGWLEQPAHWSLHPKFAGVPFIVGLSNRVLGEDVSVCVRACKRALRGLGELPTADVRATFEILYAHALSHRAIVYSPIVSALADGMSVCYYSCSLACFFHSIL